MTDGSARGRADAMSDPGHGFPPLPVRLPAGRRRLDQPPHGPGAVQRPARPIGRDRAGADPACAMGRDRVRLNVTSRARQRSGEGRRRPLRPPRPGQVEGPGRPALDHQPGCGLLGACTITGQLEAVPQRAAGSTPRPAPQDKAMPAIDALNAVHERTRRFIAASGCQGKRGFTPKPSIDLWAFYRWTHPLEGWAMAYGYGPGAAAHASGGVPAVRLALGAVRTGADAASIEVTAGLELYNESGTRNLHSSLRRAGLVGPGELIPSWETAHAYVGTTRLRCAWKGMAAPPDVVELRTFPRIGSSNAIVLPIWRELPDLHWEPGHPEVDEVSLSARSSAFGAGSKMVVGLPWCSRENELFYEIDMECAHAALQAVRAAVTPPPAG